MPKCKECGYEASRLQWTHFKYNCSGRFNNGTEYKAAYPGAILVDADLAKRTGVTKANMIAKYGEEEGTQRWNEYKAKQAESNSLEYKRKKHRWTEEQFNKFNKSRAVTLESMINKHGETDGLRRWNEYKARQAYTNTLTYFVEKYGEMGEDKYKELNRAKGHSIETIMKRNNCSIDDALAISQAMHTNRHSISALEESFCLRLEEMLKTSLDFSCRTKQYCIWSSTNNRPYFYDVVHNNRAIEFNGDYWHSNPAIYEENYYNRCTDTIARDKWMQDTAKIDALLEERNIETLVVWEQDYIR